MFRRYDILVIIFFLLLALGLFYFNYIRNEGVVLKVYVSNREVFSKSLGELKSGERFEVQGPLGKSVFEYIEGKGVHMISSPCPDKICIKQGFINKVGESIVCLPNRVVITWEGRK